MKRNINRFLLLAGTLFSFSSCADFLDTESSSVQSSQNVFENEGMAKAAIMGVYSQLAGTYVYGQKMSVNWQGVSDTEMASAFTDKTNTDKVSDTGAANYWCDWYNSTVKWGDIFRFAELAGTAVEGTRHSSLMKTKPDVMKRFLGEALVLRSLAYFELVRRWGDVPYKAGVANSDLSNVYIGKVDRDSIYASIIIDMQEAVNYLPWVGEVSDYNCERVTKGFAKGLLARIALFAGGWSVRDGNQFSDANVEHYPNIENNPGMKEMNGYYVGRSKEWKKFYEIAEQQCAEMLSDPLNRHQLDPDYGNIWKTVCHLDYNAHHENLFEVANGLGYSGDIGSLMGYAFDGGTRYGSRGFGGSYVSTTGYYFYSFSPEDKRRDYACSWTNYTKEGKEKMRNDLLNVNLGKWNFFWTSDSYKALHLTATSRISTGINWILMRYSDIFLMFAEARYALEGADAVNEVAGMSARQALEKVRERAFGAGSAQVKQYDPDFFHAIVNERAWEFGGEGIRKLDLVRWGLLDTKIEAMKEALCLMMDGTQPVEIFDKTYQPADFPDKVYFKFKAGGEFIDVSSANFNKKLPFNPDNTVYSEASWFPVTYWDPKRVTTNIPNYVKVLIAASGLRASYDYSHLFSRMQYGNEINASYVTYTTGNGTCNYRHLYSIYYDDIYKSNGYLTNSYGYDYK